jgi:hypothetical protein
LNDGQPGSLFWVVPRNLVLGISGESKPLENRNFARSPLLREAAHFRLLAWPEKQVLESQEDAIFRGRSSSPRAPNSLKAVLAPKPLDRIPANERMNDKNYNCSKFSDVKTDLIYTL